MSKWWQFITFFGGFMMKYQQLLTGSILMILTMTGCGKKEETSPAASSKPITTTEQNQVKNVKLIELKNIEILSAQTRELDVGTSEVTGIYKGDINSVIPCLLTLPIDLKKSLSESMPIVNLTEVSSSGSGLVNGKISTFEIKRNNKNQSIIGLRLTDAQGKIILSQEENYVDVKADPAKCTQMLTERYEMHNADGKRTRRTLNIVSVLEGDIITKTTTIVDNSRILAIQIERLNGAEVDQYCVTSATLAQGK